MSTILLYTVYCDIASVVDSAGVVVFLLLLLLVKVFILLPVQVSLEYTLLV